MCFNDDHKLFSYATISVHLRRDEVERHLPDSLLLKMDDSSNVSGSLVNRELVWRARDHGFDSPRLQVEAVMAEVRQWKAIADELIAANMPLFGGYRMTSFADDLR